MKNLSTLSLSVSTLAALVNPVVNALPLFPFIGAKACKTELETRETVQDAMLAVLFHSQTAHEQGVKSTTDKNRVGFMSSQAKHGTILGEKVVNGEELTTEERALATKIVTSYSRQMSVVLREVAMTADPALREAARKFSIV